jgi:hypothetical protein
VIANRAVMLWRGSHHRILHNDHLATNTDRPAVFADDPRPMQDTRARVDFYIAADRRIGGDPGPVVDLRPLALMLDQHFLSLRHQRGEYYDRAATSIF